VESAPLAVFLSYLEHLPLLLETGKSNTFNQKETRNADSVGLKQIPIVERILESGK
jgi:hypothetical protein